MLSLFFHSLRIEMTDQIDGITNEQWHGRRICTTICTGVMEYYMRLNLICLVWRCYARVALTKISAICPLIALYG
uniref:Uncharacterized protein n=1 Tax=Triticum urartu TaxID=4572 RepID=A0A8R7QTX5_TRIUA